MFHSNQRAAIYVDTTSVSSSGGKPVSGGGRILTKRYVHNINATVLFYYHQVCSVSFNLYISLY